MSKFKLSCSYWSAQSDSGGLAPVVCFEFEKFGVLWLPAAHAELFQWHREWLEVECAKQIF
jgi:hypothetical protein